MANTNNATSYRLSRHDRNINFPWTVSKMNRSEMLCNIFSLLQVWKTLRDVELKCANTPKSRYKRTQELDEVWPRIQTKPNYSFLLHSCSCRGPEDQHVHDGTFVFVPDTENSRLSSVSPVSSRPRILHPHEIFDGTQLKPEQASQPDG